MNALAVNVEPDRLHIPKYNESLNTRFTLANQYLIKQYNRLFPHKPYRQAILGPVIAAARKEPEFVGPTRLCSPRAAQRILDQFKASNQKLAELLDLHLPPSYFAAGHQVVDDIDEADIAAQAFKLLFKTIERQQNQLAASNPKPKKTKGKGHT